MTKIQNYNFPQWMLLLENIYFEKKTYTAKIVKDMKLTYAHANIVSHFLEEKGFINMERKGRVLNISLTKLGRETGALINKLRSKVNDTNRQDN